MISPFRGGFSLRGSKTPPWYIVVAIAIAAFGIGVGAGWLTGVIPDVIRGLESEPDPSPSTTIDPQPTTAPTIVRDMYPNIVRAMDADDALAGLNSLDIPLAAAGTMVPVPGQDEPAPEGDTRWVRIEVEEGLPVANEVVADYIMELLNDDRGWASGPSQTFARTEGVPEIRILLASPQTAAALCVRPHDPVTVDIAPVDTVKLPELAQSLDPASVPDETSTKKSKNKAAEEESEPSPSPSAEASPEPDLEPSCADRGLVVVNAYYWAAGVAGFAEDRPSARAWLLNHFVGHFRGFADVNCVDDGKEPAATVMADHFKAIEPCTPQAWPFPDGYQPPAGDEEAADADG